MKFTSKITAGLASVGLLVAVSAQEPVKFTVPGVSAPAAPAAAPTPPPAPKFTETQILEAYGLITGLQMGLSQLEFTKPQVEAMARGMMRAAAGEQPTEEFQAIGPALREFMGKKNEAYMGKLKATNLAEGAALFAKLKENKNVVELPSGLRYEILKAGTGAVAKPGQVASVHYTGSLANGQVFDSSVERGQPMDMTVEPGAMIAGVVEGLQKIGAGGKIKLYLPPALAYGDEGNQGIPPAATLVFDLEVLSVKDAPKEAAAPAPAAK
jgi:FKBP-type peptidyl-prolyl cis-trans isomerase